MTNPAFGPRASTACVATQRLKRELEAVDADDPELLGEDGVLAWWVSHAEGTKPAADAIVLPEPAAEASGTPCRQS